MRKEYLKIVTVLFIQSQDNMYPIIHLLSFNYLPVR